jgi:hypothetical protein
MFRNLLSFYGDELWAPLPHTSSRSTSCLPSATAYLTYSQLLSIFWNVLFHPQTEDASCCSDVDPLIVGLWHMYETQRYTAWQNAVLWNVKAGSTHNYRYIGRLNYWENVRNVCFTNLPKSKVGLNQREIRASHCRVDKNSSLLEYGAIFIGK